ncbi:MULTISPECIES: hypothetical protein [unclassified Caballeronia]|uniref:hypothetical protein n=1 Tax=unclassified Caballeronia TaxID=2646786 RepID=UPI00285619E3|nr:MULTISPECIES: hypothetical protein [unclassified Caballeronia]MDR5776607.1 hypothetical protein [Caballeronia sp. LZ002]MDR5800563.1 hypothetical protein [Caballeronia sp. LZ001]MDR5802504.1 hypothetical protein [Caballeronia sp. LZ001]MDR5852037.1 hypothetical protein [Caballeronia sp. LZ003]
MKKHRDLTQHDRHAVDDLINRWVEWCRTRRIFVPPVKSNVLARLRPSRRTRTDEPDAFLDAEMPYLNMAIHALCERPDFAGDAECFLGVYWYRANIKVIAHQLQCSRGTVYNRARAFARRAQSHSATIRRIHEHFTSADNNETFVVSNSEGSHAS